MPLEPDIWAGRSRGGVAAKIHLACEQGRGPLSALITAGHRGDSPQFLPLLNPLRAPGLGPGRPAPARTGSRGRGLLVAGQPRLPSRAEDRRDDPVTVDQHAHRLERGSAAGVRPRSTRTSTGSVTRSNAGSTCSDNIALSPPGRTSRPCATRPPCTSPSELNGPIGFADPWDRMRRPTNGRFWADEVHFLRRLSPPPRARSRPSPGSDHSSPTCRNQPESNV